MILVYAFLVGAAICALGQLAASYLKAHPLLVLQCTFALGGLLNPFGVNDILTNWAGGGYQVLIAGGGAAVAGTSTALVAGSWQPIVMLLLLFAVLVAMGMVFGLVRPLPGTIPEAAVEN